MTLVVLDVSSPLFSPAVYAAALTAAAGFLGSWVGAQLALLSFKRQRAFDKQLDWYERADKSLQELIEKIEIALTFQDEKGTPAADLRGIGVLFKAHTCKSIASHRRLPSLLLRVLPSKSRPPPRLCKRWRTKQRLSIRLISRRQKKGASAQTNRDSAGRAARNAKAVD
jgi:hypothetical protein